VNNGSKDFGRITSPEGDRVIATPEARATYERDRNKLLRGVSTVNSVSGYTPRIPTLIGAWVKTERKRNAAHGDSHFQTESELRAEGERAIDAHDAEVRQEVKQKLQPVIDYLEHPGNWGAGDFQPTGRPRLLLSMVREAFDETDI